MTAFLIALIALVAGYFIYGSLVEKIFGSDRQRQTPAKSMADGIDYVELPTWKVFLIQFLNIAGVGPIFGAIMGVMYGPAAFIWIVLGTIFAGAVHDFISGMISVRMGGKSLPEIVGTELGKKIKMVMSIFTCVLLVMVIAVFVRTPANLLATLTPDHLNVTFWATSIFLYYILATLLPIDKLIGNLYPVFGFALLFMAAGIMGYMIVNGVVIPEGFSDGLFNRHPAGEAAPIFPMMCISIACGAISGFHATQSPMMARCIKNERYGRPVFYGAMVSEGIVALIWAAAAIAFTGGYDKLADYMAGNGQDAGILVHEVCVNWLGTFGGVLAILGVIAAPVTTGDTAMRSLRLIIADSLGISQKKVVKRLLVTIPIVLVSYVLINVNFDVLWRYFAWCNQTLSIFTLWACTVYLARHRKMYYITMVPAMFMTMLCVTFISYAPLGTYVEGLGLPLLASQAVGLIAMAVCTGCFYVWKRSLGPVLEPAS
uniref:Carbon starvation protein A n=1 Tax=uncultured Muribaculaceae bacterium TaxID=2301481 RepID=A0A6G8F3T6_9BACT|nr:carbon starvation protein A [uncultured Muribaculaceae bacterium]